MNNVLVQHRQRERQMEVERERKVEADSTRRVSVLHHVVFEPERIIQGVAPLAGS